MKRKAISIILALAVLGNQVGITTVSAEGFVSGEPFAETDMQEYQTDDFVSGNTDSKTIIRIAAIRTTLIQTALSEI